MHNITEKKREMKAVYNYIIVRAPVSIIILTAHFIFLFYFILFFAYNILNLFPFIRALSSLEPIENGPEIKLSSKKCFENVVLNLET